VLTDSRFTSRYPEEKFVRGPLSFAPPREQSRNNVSFLTQDPVEDLSVRVGRNEIQNVTERETKRRRDRPKDLDYKRRFSVSSDLPITIAPQFGRYSAEHEPVGGYAWPREDHVLTQHVVTSEFGQRVVVKSGRLQCSPMPSVPSPDGLPFQIKLIYSGQTVLHQVWDQMLVSQLAEEAGSILASTPHSLC
jgi:hypothetical protein